MALKYGKLVDLNKQNQMKLLSNIKINSKNFSFSTKMAPLQTITDIALLSFLTKTAPHNVYFIARYQLFLRIKNKIFVFQWI